MLMMPRPRADGNSRAPNPGPMATRDLAELTWEEARDLGAARAVAVLPVGAIEAHGPHLPLATDVIIADAMARAGAAALERRGVAATVLPPLTFTAAPFARAFAGTISIDPAAVREVVSGVARDLTARGFRVLALANAHLDPTHLAALHEAATGPTAPRPARIAFPDLTRRPWALRLGEEFLTGACHAGRFETSIVLATRPELVRERIRRDLAPNPRSLSVAIKDGKRTFEEAGGPQAYFGWPADATAAEGRDAVDTLGTILADAVVELLSAEGTA